MILSDLAGTHNPNWSDGQTLTISENYGTISEIIPPIPSFF
jgi:hypothetical protein